MVTPNVILQYQDTDAGREYFLHFTTTFSGSDYVPTGSSVVQVPASLDDDLIVVLTVQATSEGVNPVVQEVSIGTFPQQIESWVLKATVLDQNETKIGEVIEVQSREEAQER